MLGDDGLLTGEASPRVIADASTVSAEASELIRNAANSRGCRLPGDPGERQPEGNRRRQTDGGKSRGRVRCSTRSSRC